MTNFERTYLLSKPTQIAISYQDGNRQSEVNDVSTVFQKQRQELAMQMQYRELDRIVNEFERELQLLKALRKEMEQYKVNFSMSVEDEATKKIQEVMSGLDRMFK